MIKNVIYIFSMLYLSEFCMYGNSFLPPNIYSKGKLGEGGGGGNYVSFYEFWPYWKFSRTELRS